MNAIDETQQREKVQTHTILFGKKLILFFSVVFFFVFFSTRVASNRDKTRVCHMYVHCAPLHTHIHAQIENENERDE